MKVLKRPEKNQVLWSKEYTCTGRGWIQNGKTPCGCLLSVSITDIRRRFHTDITGETDSYFGFICSECGCFTEIPYKDIPSELHNMIKDY